MQQLRGNYRTYRFPSLATVEARETGQPNPHQSGYDDGHAEGMERGFQQGLSEGKEQGHQEGLEKGKQEGYSQGYDEGRQVFEKAMETLNLIQKEVEDLRKQSLKEYTDQICQLVDQVARQVIHAELTLNPHQMLKLAEDAIGRMDTTKGDISVFVSEGDYKRLAEAGISTVGDYPIKSDNNLTAGDCRLVSEDQEMTIRSDERVKKCVEEVREELNQ